MFERMISTPQKLARRTHAKIRERWSAFHGYTPTDRNLYFLTIEVIGAGLATGMVGFNAPLVLKLGGSSSLVGLMAALPALMVILFAVPFGNFMERKVDRKPYVVGALFAARALFLLIGLVPWLVPAAWQPYAIVALVVIQGIPVALFNAGFLSLIADVSPPNRRSSFFSARWLLIAGSWGISSFLSGLWLEATAFPFNYQMLNFVAFAASEWSTYLVNHATFPTYVVHPKAEPTHARKKLLDIPALKTFVRENRSYANLNITILITFLGVWGAAPLFTLYFVNTLKLSESWLGINGLLGQVGIMAGALLGNHFIKKYSDSWVLRRILLAFWLYPLLIVLLPNAQTIWVLSFVFIALDPVMNVAILNVLYRLIPEQRRSSWMSAHIALMNVGAMLAPLLTVELAQVANVQTALLACAVFRLVGVVLFWVLPYEQKAQA